MSEYIRKAIRRMAGELPEGNVVCRVKAVYADTCTCDCEPIDGTADWYDVRLRATNDGSAVGLLVFPTVESFVIIGTIGSGMNAAACVIQCSEIDEVWVVNQGGMQLKVKPDVIELNGSTWQLIKDTELKNELKKVNEVLQALLDVINGSEIMEPGNGQPSALKAALMVAVTGKVLPTYNDITNEKVTHG